MTNTIYTRTGDNGTSGLIGNERRAKTDPVFEAIGCIDEVNAQLGWCLTLVKEPAIVKALQNVQSDLFTIGASLADTEYELPVIQTKRITTLEQQIDQWWSAAPPLTRFILPGGHPIAAALHITRATVRRAERALVQLSLTQTIDSISLTYVNRLSDYLFAAARFVNAQNSIREQTWTPTNEA
jgi:cob(I)alamin adenosyltransferase